MQMRGWAITMGVGAALGAVAVTMLPRHSPTRRMVNKAAASVEDAVCQMSNKLSREMNH